MQAHCLHCRTAPARNSDNSLTSVSGVPLNACPGSGEVRVTVACQRAFRQIGQMRSGRIPKVTAISFARRYFSDRTRNICSHVREDVLCFFSVALEINGKLILQRRVSELVRTTGLAKQACFICVLEKKH
jgi:hypothetical protein